MTVALEARHIRLVTERTVDCFLQRLFLRDAPIRNLCIVSPFISTMEGSRITLRDLSEKIERECIPTVHTVKRAHNLDLAGKMFAELEPDLKRAILDDEFDVHVLPPRIDDREIIQIFRRMNSTNYSLTKQELRNAHYYGEFKTAA